MKKLLYFFSALLLGTNALAEVTKHSHLPKGFVYLATVAPSIQQKVGFVSEDNVLGVKADGYEAAKIICTKEAALAVAKVQKQLKKKGLCLQVTDAYRPERTVKHIQRWAQDLNDQKTKARYYPTIPKEELWGTYIAARQSSHSRGSTFDLIILDDKTKEPLDFGPDIFGEESWTFFSGCTEEQKHNRLMLRKIMMDHGFKPYDKEFWHFTLKNEPFPKTYFDFPVR